MRSDCSCRWTSRGDGFASEAVLDDEAGLGDHPGISDHGDVGQVVGGLDALITRSMVAVSALLPSNASTANGNPDASGRGQPG
jgi:hypothetical protein